MGKKDKQNKGKEASFSTKSVDEKLDQLYQMMRAESGVNKKWREEVRDELKSVSKKVSHLEKRVHHVESNNKDMQSEITVMQNAVHEIQQTALALDIIIKGIPEVEQSNTELCGIIRSVFEKINCSSLLSEVAAVTRLGRQPADNTTANRTRVILLQMKTLRSKQQLMELKRKTKLNCSDITFNEQPLATDKLIFFDERLTKYTSDLHYEARQLKSKKVCHSVWIRNGTVFVRKNQTSEAKKIISSQQLQLLNKRSRKSTPESEDDDESIQCLSEDSETSDADEDDSIAEPDPKKNKKDGDNVGGPNTRGKARK